MTKHSIENKHKLPFEDELRNLITYAYNKDDVLQGDTPELWIECKSREIDEFYNKIKKERIAQGEHPDHASQYAKEYVLHYAAEGLELETPDKELEPAPIDKWLYEENKRNIEKGFPSFI